MGGNRLRSFTGWSQRNGLFYAVVILAAIFTAASPHFLTRANLTVVLLQVSVVGLVAVPGAMLILSGYVDLAVGSVAVLAAVVFGELTNDGLPEPVAFVIALLMGPAWGLVSGFLIATLNFSPIVVTLGGLAGARGLAELIGQGITRFGFGPGFDTLGNGTLLALPIPVWLCGAVFFGGAYVWYQMPYGRHMTAIGSDRLAAHALGIPIKRIPLLLYVASGLAAALGGLIQESQLDASSLSIGQGLEIEVLTAILLGGVSFVGGRGSLFGVLMGVLFIGILNNGLILINISAYVEGAVVGLALVLAAGLDVLYQRLDRIQFRDEPEPSPDQQQVSVAERAP